MFSCYFSSYPYSSFLKVLYEIILKNLERKKKNKEREEVKKNFIYD